MNKTYNYLNFTIVITLLGILHSGGELFANNFRTNEAVVDPPKAYLIDHRGVPLFDETNTTIQSANYSDLQMAGLSADHLQTHPDGDGFFWEISRTHISNDDYNKTGGPPNFTYVRFEGDIYAFNDQYYFVPKDESEGFPADAYNDATGDFHFLPSRQAVYNHVDGTNGDAKIGPHFWETINSGLAIVYTLKNLALPTLAYGDTETLESDVEGVITLNLSDSGMGDISFTGNGNKKSVLDLGSVISSHEEITINPTQNSASIALPDSDNSTFSFSNQRWLSYTTTDSDNNSRRVGVYIGTNGAETVLGDIFRFTNLLNDIHEIVVYVKNGENNVTIFRHYVPYTVDTAKIYGGSSKDNFTGIEDVPTTMYGDGGNDTIAGRSNDIMFGGAGDDTLSAYVSTVTNLTYFGGDGNDVLTGRNQKERLYGGDGNDQILSKDGQDVIYGGGGNDQLELGNGVDILVFDGGGDGTDGVGALLLDGQQYNIFENRDKLYFMNTTMTSRDDLTISPAQVNGNEVVSIAYTSAPSDNKINLFNVDMEDAHLIRRSNIVFEDASGNVTVNVDDTATGPFFWPVITDENFNYSAISHSISGADNGLFSIDDSSGALSFNPTLDANNLPVSDSGEKGTYKVTLTSTAGTTDVTKNLTIYINETQAPTITSSTTAVIDENIGPGQVVYTIRATDNVAAASYAIGGTNVPDDNVSGVTSYAIGGTDASHFSVDAKTGEVRLTADPDYENKSTYSFEARAFDAQLNIAKTDVTLTINDVSDESTLSVEEISSNILMYNNPVRKSLQITSDEKLRQLRIFSINGRKVFEKELNTNSQNIDLSKLASGLYLLELATETQIKRGKLLKE